jgi:acyl-CoA thioester hydrolase
MPRADFRFSYPKRVRFAEVDAQAVVFNPRYLEYFDIGLVEYFRAAGLYVQSGLAAGPDMHVARALVEFRAPILLDEEVHVHVAEVRGRPSPVPADIIAKFETYEGRNLRTPA